MKYDSILPEEINQYQGNLILSTSQEAPIFTSKAILFEEIFDKDPAIIQGLMIRHLKSEMEEDKLVLGIDPGKRIGLSVFYYGKEIERTIFTSIDQLIEHTIKLLAELKAGRKIVKIGNGDMGLAKKITTLLNLKFCSDFELEFVDERRTSVKRKNHNQRGKRDMLSAKFISQREGYRHLVLPLSRIG